LDNYLKRLYLNMNQPPPITELTDLDLVGAMDFWHTEFLNAQLMLNTVKSEYQRRKTEAEKTVLPPTPPEIK